MPADALVFEPTPDACEILAGRSGPPIWGTRRSEDPSTGIPPASPRDLSVDRV